jgi:hypothetical protein
MAKHDRTGRAKNEPRHVRLYEYIAGHPSWRALSSNARSAWLEIGLICDGTNNGRLAVSTRALGARMGFSKNVAGLAIRELENAGFLKCVKASSFSQKKLAAEYRLTHLRCNVTGASPTHDYRREITTGAAAVVCGVKACDIREATDHGHIAFRDVDGVRLCEIQSVHAYQRRLQDHPRACERPA